MPQPEKIAEPADVGDTRTTEDEDLFGGVPDLRVDRTSTGSGIADGSGLRDLM